MGFPIAVVDFDAGWLAARGHELPVATGCFMVMNIAELSSIKHGRKTFN
jgi:hypothetical protein